MFNKYPYTDFHELNLDWILKQIREINYSLDNFIVMNTIKYADPIGWDITTQYEANTVVIDQATGIAYISTRPVPAGITISNTDYWSVIFNLQQIIGGISENLTFHNNGTSPTLLTSVNENDWILWNNKLYYALANLPAGTALIIDSNIKASSVEELTKDYTDIVKNIVGALADLTTTDTSSIVNAVNSVKTELDQEVIDRGNADTGLSNDISALDLRVDTLETSVSGLKYYVTPEDYGATGGADDTNAVQAAIDDGRPVVFTQNYNIRTVTIPFDSQRTIQIDFNNFWLNYIGDGTDTACLVMRGHSCTLKNIKINNTTGYSLIGMYWTSASNSVFSGYNLIEGCTIYNFNTGIYYGDVNGIVDAPQSENNLSGFRTRGCNIAFYSNMNNAIININNSVIASSLNEATYNYDVNRAACIRCDSGLVMVDGSEIIKVDNTSGYGIWGSNIHISDCVLEIASPWIYAAGNITLDNIKGGFYSSPNSPVVTVDPAASGMLVLNKVINRPSTATNTKLVSAVSGYNGSDNYKVMISDCQLPDRVYAPTLPITDYPVIVKSSVINGESIDLHTVKFNKNNYNKLTLSQATAAISGNDVVITSSGLYPNIALPAYSTSGSMQIYGINVTSLTGNWNITAAQTDAAGTVTYSTQALHDGMNVFVISGFDSVTLNITGSAVTDVLSFDDIQVGLM